MKYLFILLLLSYCTNSYGQTVTFNKRMTFGCVNTILTSVYSTDSCYFITGVARDTNNCQKGTFFGKFDSLGNNIYHTITPQIESWFPFLDLTPDNKFVVVPYFYDSLGMWGGVCQFDFYGNLVQKDTISNTYQAGTYIRPDDMIVTTDSGFLITPSIQDTTESRSNVQYLKLDKNRNMQWEQLRGESNALNDTRGDILQEPSGNYLIAYREDNITPVTSNHHIQCHLEMLDTAGNSLWTWQSPSNQQIYGANDIIKTKDGGWVIASAWGYEQTYPNGNTLNFSTPYLFKLDTARNLVWDRVFESRNSGPNDEFFRLIEITDSSIVAFGSNFTALDSPIYNTNYGRITKVSSQGDSIWDRNYAYMVTRAAFNKIYDAKATPDGGFIICGESVGTGQGAIQQGWLLKLDQYGCLVPGCHLPLGVLPREVEQGFRISLFPNPTTDYLNVYYSHQKQGEQLNFTLYDLQGRVVQQQQSAAISDQTYILPVYDLAAGVYVLEVRQDGVLLEAQQFVLRSF